MPFYCKTDAGVSELKKEALHWLGGFGKSF